MAALVEAPYGRIQTCSDVSVSVSSAATDVNAASTSDPPASAPASTTASLQLVEGYIIKRDTLLGEGSYSSVYEAIHIETGKVVAAKLTDLTVKARYRCFKNEVKSFKLLPHGHKNLVEYYGDCIVGNDLGVIILEKLTSLALDDYISTYGRLATAEALEIFEQIVSVVAYLHERKISPRDLKNENISFNPATRKVKVFDLGLAMVINTRADGSFPPVNATNGSPLYMAPEVLACKPHNTFAHDIWCLGQILYAMLVGRSPFHWCSNFAELRDELLVFKKIKYPSYLDYNTTQYLKSLLEFDPKLRPDIRGVRESLFQLMAAMQQPCDNSESGEANGDGK